MNTNDMIIDGTSTLPYEVGSKVLIRTVTMTQVGRIEAVYPKEIVLVDGSWVADTGRFSNALATGELSEVERIPGRYIVGRGAIVDCCEWWHDLPTETK